MVPYEHQRVHTDTVEEMAKFARNIAAADDCDRLRHFLEFKDVIARPVWKLERRTFRAAAGRQDEFVGRDRVIVDPESSVGGKRSLAAIECHVLPERIFENTVVLAGELKCVMQDRIGIGHPHGCLESKPPGRPRTFGGVSVADEQFRRDATAMRTGASSGPFSTSATCIPLAPH
jgi:hypothetical protein